MLNCQKFSRMGEFCSSKMALAVFAEFLGTFILVAVGNASVAQSQLTNGVKGDFFATNWGWAIGVMLGLLVSAKASGGHLNPAISFALALFRKFSWKRMIMYWIAQYVGALVASGVVLGIYHEAILQGKVDGEFRIHRNHSDPGTAAIFANYPSSDIFLHTSVLTGLAEETLATTLFVLTICVVTDKSLANIPHYLQPLYIGLSLLAMGIAYGSMSGYALNPARDLSPRLVTLIGGWGGYVFSFRGYNWFWIFIAGPHAGAIIGVGIFVVLQKLSIAAQKIAIEGPQSEEEGNVNVSSYGRASTDQATNIRKRNEHDERYVNFNDQAVL